MGEAKKIKFLISFSLAAIFFIALPKVANAANLYFSPASGSHAVGTTFSMGVYVSSSDQAMNAASGVISFPQDKLEIASVSKSGSIFSFWVQDPSFSNASGTANFEGIVLNPGFKGSGGKIMTINFKVKTSGTADLKFSSGSALANDGQGTNILKSLGNAKFTLGGAASTVPEAAAPPVVSGTPSAPKIVSATHPDSNKWYNNKNPQFSWTLPAGVNGVGIYFSQSPSSNPGPVPDGIFTSKSYENVADGIWYFHLKMKNSAGWGPITHFKIQIDTAKPSNFNITEVQRTDPTEPKTKFIFDAKDETSGIDHYEIQIDNESPQIWQDDGSHQYETPIIDQGKHILSAKAVDKAGNSLAGSVEFAIEPLNPPTITDFPKELQSDELLIIRGSTYSNSKVTIWLQKENDEPKSFTVSSDKDGKFTFTAAEKLGEGTYTLWAEVVDDRGARSLLTEKVTIVVSKSVIFNLGTWPTSFLETTILLILIIIALILILWRGRHKYSLLKKKINKERRDTVRALHKSLNLLISNSQNQLKLLAKAESKRQLTEEENRIIKHLEKDLNDAEKFNKKINDIEKN